MPRPLPTTLAVFTVALFALANSANAVTTLIDEEFTGGDQPTNTPFVTWSDSDGGSFETYSSGGAGVRDMNSNYDHDQNGGTANITIPGGIEVNDDSGPATLTATVLLPGDLLAGSDLLTFFAGTRSATGPAPTITITNTTDATTILAATAVMINANDNIWEFNSQSGLFTAADAGDTIKVDWFGGGNGSANGLQLADIEFSVETGPIVPEPTTVTLSGLAAAGLLLRRKRSV